MEHRLYIYRTRACLACRFIHTETMIASLDAYEYITDLYWVILVNGIYIYRMFAFVIKTIPGNNDSYFI